MTHPVKEQVFDSSYTSSFLQKKKKNETKDFLIAYVVE